MPNIFAVSILYLCEKVSKDKSYGTWHFKFYIFTLKSAQHGIDRQWMVSASRHQNETNNSSVRHNVIST